MVSFMRLFLAAIIILISCVSHAQRNWCATDHGFRPGIIDSLYHQLLSQILEHEKHDLIRTRSVRYFQVVVHSVLPEGFAPLTTAQVLNQIDVLNRDFAGTGQNSINVLPEFKSLIANTELQFCLATTDPEGQPT